MRFRAEQTGRVREHRGGVGLGEARAGQRLEEDLGVLTGHVGVGLAVGRHEAEVPEAIDDLLGRSAADPQLQTTTRDEVGGTGIFDHVERVLVAHVDDCRPDLDALGASTDRRQERERRRKLLGEVVDAEVRTVGTQVLDRLGEFDRLDERVRARPDLRVGRFGPMSERQEADLLHTPILGTTRPPPGACRVSSRTRTSTTRCAAAGRRARVLGSRGGVDRAATGTPSGRPPRSRLQALLLAPP